MAIKKTWLWPSWYSQATRAGGNNVKLKIISNIPSSRCIERKCITQLYWLVRLTVAIHILEEGNPNLEQAFNFLDTFFVRKKQDDVIITLYNRVMMGDNDFFTTHDCTNRGSSR